MSCWMKLSFEMYGIGPTPPWRNLTRSGKWCVIRVDKKTTYALVFPLNNKQIQKLHTTAPDQLTDRELLLSSISVSDLDRKHSGGWDKEYPKCTFGSKAFQWHMTSQITDRGKHQSETAVCNMERKKDDELKPRFLTVRKEIYHHYTEKQ